MFFDELSWRQHKRTLTKVENPIQSATVVNLYCAPSAAILSPQNTFFIRRLPLDMAFAECTLSEQQDFKTRKGAFVTFESRMRDGFYLYNPHQPLFSAAAELDSVYAAQRTALDQNSPLPEELKQKILLEAQPDPWLPMPVLIDGDLGFGEEVCVQPLIQLDAGQKEHVRETIQKRLDLKTSPRIGAWKSITPASRRDVSRILERLEQWQGRIIFILQQPQEGKDLDTAIHLPMSKYFLSHDIFKAVVFRRHSLESLANVWKRRMIGDDFSWSHGYEKDERTEVFLDPLRFFPPSFPPRWLQSVTGIKIGRRTDQDSNNGLHQANSLGCLVFYLTNSLTQAEKQTNETMIQKGSIESGPCLFVPWEENREGGIGDVLQLMKQMLRAEALAFLSGTPYKFAAFIDKQGGKEKQPIIAQWRSVS